MAGPSGPAFLINFYPRSPCGERLEILLPCLAINNFYPRSPCGERHEKTPLENILSQFLSTLSLRRATYPRVVAHFMMSIFLSTLSLRRATLPHNASCNCHSDFYPRSPCGERLMRYRIKARYTNFYPRSPCGERPYCPHMPHVVRDFYPRSPCGERQQKCRDRKPHVNFYPRSPCGERPWRSDCPPSQSAISIHALLAESDGQPSSV